MKCVQKIIKKKKTDKNPHLKRWDFLYPKQFLKNNFKVFSQLKTALLQQKSIFYTFCTNKTINIYP